MTTATKARYRTPTIYPDVDPVSLSDFSIDDIREYLANEGEDVDSGEGCLIHSDDMGRAETLVLCGQREAARELILGIVSEAMGRPL